MKKPGKFKTWLIHKLGGKLESEIFIEPVKVYVNVRKVVAQKAIDKFDLNYISEEYIKEELCNKLYEEQIKPTMKIQKQEQPWIPGMITYQVEYNILEERE